MRQIIEGAGMLGKSTWIDQVRPKQKIFHFSKEVVMRGISPFDFNGEMMYWMDNFSCLDHAILDRGHLGGFIWGKLFGFHKWDMSWDQLKLVHRFSKELGWDTKIFATVDEAWYRDRIAVVADIRGEEPDVDLLLSANRIYLAIGRLLGIQTIIVGPGGWATHE